MRQGAWWRILGALFILSTSVACAGGGAPSSTSRPGAADLPAASAAPAAPREPGDDGQSAAGPAQQPLADQPLIVYTGSMRLEVADIRAAVDQALAVVSGVGGYLAASDQHDASDNQVAEMTYRIPAARWAETLNGLRAIGQRADSETTNSEDVTAQVVDLEARLTNLRATEAAFQGIMTRATTITDILKVQDELTRVRQEIEQLTAQRDHLADRAALGTLTVTFFVPIAAASVASHGWDLGREVDSAVAALVRVAQGITSLAVWLAIVVVPVAIPVVLLFVLGFKIRNRTLARHRASAGETPPV